MAGGFSIQYFRHHSVLNANLFFINPNGIVFGPAARNVSGPAYFSTVAQSASCRAALFCHDSRFGLDPLRWLASNIWLPGARAQQSLSCFLLAVPCKAIIRLLDLWAGPIQINGSRIIAQAGSLSVVPPLLERISVPAYGWDPFSGGWERRS